MTENLESKIINEISKSGFPLELRVAEQFRNRGYLTNQSVYFVDNDEGKGRELDILAHKFVRREKKKQQWFVDGFLITECKKSDKPWIVFTSPKDGEDDNIFAYDTMDELNLELSVWSAETIWDVVINPIIGMSPLFNYPRLGRTYFVPFTNSESGDAIFKALTTSVKAAVSIKENPGYGGSRLLFYYPNVVLQGRLFESYLDKNETKLSEVDMLPVSFTYQSAKYEPVHFIVPIITEIAFGKYLDAMEKVMDFWVKVVQDRVELLNPDDIGV